MAQLEFTLERGGVLTAEIFTDLVPATWQAITAVMPVTWKIYNARWTGREVFTQCDLPNKPPRENQTIRASLGDVIYACEREDRDKTGFEAIGLFYGPEVVNDWRGTYPVNYIGRIDPTQWALIQEIGERVWRQGGEECRIRAIVD